MKDKKMMILLAVIVLLLFGLSFLKTRAPKPVDWEPSFVNTKTTPYGTYITYQLLSDIFEKENIKSTRTPVYNNVKGEVSKYLDIDEDLDDDLKSYREVFGDMEYDPSSWIHDLESIEDTTSYIFINTRFSVEKLDLEYLLYFVALGNNAFISAEIFDTKLMDTLRIGRNMQYFKADTLFTLADYPEKKYNFGNINGQIKFNIDSCQQPVRPLAFNNKKDTTFIEIQYGNGHFYLHTMPSAFANVNMLQSKKYDFGFRCLSYLPQNSKIIWDEYQKQGAIGEGSDFKMMLQNPSLRIALYIILAGLLLFMIFRAKRTQRIIPIIKPPVNSSVEFLNTISNLYYRKKDFNFITEKRHAYFLDFIRKNYYMNTETIDNDFINVLSAKSGVDKDKLSELFALYRDLSTLRYIPNETFLQYNSLLEEFYRNVKNK